MRPSRIALFLLISMLLAVTVAAGMLLLVDPDVFHEQVETAASAAFGRPFRIGGAIGIERSLHPKIILREITIDNPNWSAEAHFARAGHVAVRVALLPLLRGKLQVMDVTFSDMEINIEDGPGGANNYSFGESGDRGMAWGLPSIEHMLISDTRLNYRPAAGPNRRFEIATAQLWNTPGQPERIEAEGAAQDMQYIIEFTAEPDAELSGPQNPWSVKLDMQGDGLALFLEGQMPQAFAWQQFDGRVTISGEESDKLALLLGMDLPPTGPFDITAAMNLIQGAFKLTDLNGQIKRVSGKHDIEISGGGLAAGRDTPLKLNLRGMFADAPLALQLASEPLPAIAAPRPVAATLKIADTELDVQGTMATADAGQHHLTLTGQIQGQNLDTLARLLDRDLPAAGAYQFSFEADIGTGRCQITSIRGEIKDTERWDAVRVEDGRALLAPDGSVDATIEARLNDVPLSFAFKSGPEASDETDRIARPFQLNATVPGTEMTGRGAIVSIKDRFRLELTAHIEGDRLDTLGALMGIPMPPIGTYAVDTDVRSGDGIHKFQNFIAQLGADRVTGQLQWQDQVPHPLLTGRLAADHLTLKALFPPAAPTRRIQSPIDLGWFKTVDARLDISVAHLTDSLIPVNNIDTSLTIGDGRLTAPFRARVSGSPCEGQLDLNQSGNIPRIALRASTGKIDARQALRQMKLPEDIDGSIEAVHFDGHSSGRTLSALLSRAVLKVTLSPADLRYKGQFAGRPIDLVVVAAEITTDKGQPLSATFTGKVQGIPFDARASTARLAELGSAQTPVPIRLVLETAIINFSGRGTVARPFEKKVFDLEHEISGDEIEGLDPLIDLAMPMRGAFSARGTIAGRGDRLTYEEDLRVGKSEFKMTMDMWQTSLRPRITAEITSEIIYLEDIKLMAEGDTPAPAGESAYLIPDFTLPVDYLRTSNLEIDIRAHRVSTPIGDLGALASKVTLHDGHFEATSTIAKPEGARLRKFVDVNAAVDPPVNQFELDADNIDYAFLRHLVPATAFQGGTLDFHLRLSGTGTTRRKFIDHADGVITIIGGPGRLRERRIDLWAADLIPTLLSPEWQREETTEVNCMVAHVGVADGQATISDLLLDVSRVTIAATGVVNLKTEALDIIIVPRPKRASLVSLANPVNITGTLSQPEISVTSLPGRSGRRLARTGLLAGLINPLFLLTALSDTGTIDDDTCAATIERARQALDETPP